MSEADRQGRTETCVSDSPSLSIGRPFGVGRANPTRSRKQNRKMEIRVSNVDVSSGGVQHVLIRAQPAAGGSPGMLRDINMLEQLILALVTWWGTSG